MDRLRKMLKYLDVMSAEQELKIPPNYGAHKLSGDREGTWSLTVAKNYRLTFKISDDVKVLDLNLEDYH